MVKNAVERRLAVIVLRLISPVPNRLRSTGRMMAAMLAIRPAFSVQPNWRFFSRFSQRM